MCVCVCVCARARVYLCLCVTTIESGEGLGRYVCARLVLHRNRAVTYFCYLPNGDRDLALSWVAFPSRGYRFADFHFVTSGCVIGNFGCQVIALSPPTPLSLSRCVCVWFEFIILSLDKLIAVRDCSTPSFGGAHQCVKTEVSLSLSIPVSVCASVSLSLSLSISVL